MTVEEARKILNNPKMSKLECNFKVKTKTNKSKAPAWFVEFEKKNDQRWARQEQFNQFVLEQFKRQEQFNKAIMVRLDNLAAKNNLKE